MTPQDARNYFMQQLPQVRNSGELMRLTYWVLPHLAAATNRPMGDIHTIDARLQLEFPGDKMRVWYSIDRDISTQLGALEPVYTRGSSGPHFCSGLTPVTKMANAPSANAPGLPLGPFAAQHARAYKKLQEAKSIKDWWRVFMAHTPLWMRTAYNWNKPTPEQKEILKAAKKTMMGHAAELATNTTARYSRSQAHLSFPRPKSEAAFLKAPYWNALVAGQNIVDIKRSQSSELEIKGLHEAAPGVRQSIECICMVVCDLNGMVELGDMAVNKYVAMAEARAKAMRSEVPVELPAFDVPRMPML